MPKFLTRIRFLPLTIFFASLMLTVRAESIWDGFGNFMAGGIVVAQAVAQQEAGPAPEGKAEPAAVAGEKTAGAGEKTAGAREKKTAGAADAAEMQNTGQAAKPMIISDPALLTQTEIDLLQQLAERREILETRESNINKRTGLLKAAETRIDKKIIDLKTLQVTIEGLIKTYDDQQAKKMDSLVKIYESMKPKEAARIFAELDMDTLLLVAERMKERKLAPIMANMNPSKAKEMTVELTRLRQLPLVGG